MLFRSIPELGLWNPNNGIKLNDNQFPMWSTILLLSKNSIPFEYKYVLMDNYGNIKWESRENRLLSSINSSNIDYSFPISLYCNDWMPSLYLNPFKGTGIYIKLFKINTEKSIGCGQIGDICQLIDLCKLTGISLIELSNINDSLGFDSNIISSFAINPIYIDLNNIISNLPSKILLKINNFKSKFEDDIFLNYEEILNFKLKILFKIYKNINLEEDNLFKSFLNEEKNWIFDYSYFNILKKLNNNNIEYINWENIPTINEIMINNEFEFNFYLWIQYILDKQLKQVYNYSINNSIILRIEFPIYLNRFSIDSFTWSNLFNINNSIGLPPTKNNQLGLNYNLSSFNFEELNKTNYQWFYERFNKVSKYFTSIRINNLSSILKIWEIDSNNNITGLLGYYNPDKYLTNIDLKLNNLWDINRYIKPYLTSTLLSSIFGDDTIFIENTFLNIIGNNIKDNYYEFKKEFNKKKKIFNFLETLYLNEFQRKKIENGLYLLLSNIILIKDNKDFYHIKRDLNFLNSTTLINLPEPQRSIFIKLFYNLIPNENKSFYENFFSLSNIEIISNEFKSIINLWNDNEFKNYFWNKILNRFDEIPLNCETWLIDLIIKFNLSNDLLWTIIDLNDLMIQNDINFEIENNNLLKYSFKIEELNNNLILINKIKKLLIEYNRFQ